MLTSKKIDLVKKTISSIDLFLKECTLSGFSVYRGPGDDLVHEEFLVCSISDGGISVVLYYYSELSTYSVTWWREPWFPSIEHEGTTKVDDLGLVTETLSKALRGEFYT